MLGSFFLEASFGSFVAIQLFLIWSVHFVFFRKSRSRYSNSRDRAQALSRQLADQESPQVFYFLYLYLGLLVLAYTRSFVSEPQTLYFRQIALEEGGLSMLVLSHASVCIVSYTLSRGASHRRLGGAGQDFFTSVWLIAAIAPLAFLSNNLVFFFLVLEVVSASSMYMLASSRGNFGSLESAGPGTSRQLASSVFFHFWSSFFSSSLFVFVIVYLLSSLGTTEWAQMDLLLGVGSSLGGGAPVAQTSLAAYSLLGAVLIKLGASPFFFFKLEVYKGLPLVPLVVYSVLYFFVFNSIFFFILAYSMPSLLGLAVPGLALLIFVSVLYLASAMFSTPLLRNFFALSSLIGGVLVLFLLLCFFFKV